MAAAAARVAGRAPRHRPVDPTPLPRRRVPRRRQPHLAVGRRARRPRVPCSASALRRAGVPYVLSGQGLGPLDDVDRALVEQLVGRRGPRSRPATWSAPTLLGGGGADHRRRRAAAGRWTAPSGAAERPTSCSACGRPTTWARARPTSTAGRRSRRLRGRARPVRPRRPFNDQPGVGRGRPRCSRSPAPGRRVGPVAGRRLRRRPAAGRRGAGRRRRRRHALVPRGAAGARRRRAGDARRRLALLRGEGRGAAR